MLQIECPWCGPRDEEEFSYGGEAHIQRPAEPGAVSDDVWGDYLFFRANIKGLQSEQWCHSHGCRRWFNAARDTVTYRIHSVYRIGEHKPVATSAITSAITSKRAP